MPFGASVGVRGCEGPDKEVGGFEILLKGEEKWEELEGGGSPGFGEENVDVS